MKADHDLTRQKIAREGIDLWKECVTEGVTWLKSYLHTDVEELQRLKQHHVHMVNEKANEREPLAACRRKDNPKEFKSEFPRWSWLVERPVILCEGVTQTNGLADQRKKV